MIQKRNAPDRRNACGAWLRSYREGGVRYHTRAGCLWNSILTRTKTGGSFQERHETYVGVSNLFESFESFCEWCQSEFGYGFFDSNGESWGLDKDISLGRNYSKDSCMFVPKAVNNFVLDNPKYRSDLPIGVSIPRNGINYRSRITIDGVEVHLGTFVTPELAHEAWVDAKIAKAQEYIIEYSKHEKLVTALERLIKELKND